MRRAGAAIACLLVLAACSVAHATRPVTLTIFGAASLADALREAGARYQATVPGSQVVISTASSGALRAEIEAGAQPDLFLSADTANPRALAAAGLAVGEPVAFAGNRLTIIVPADNPARIRSPADLARRGVKIIAARAAAPIASYVDRLLANLARLAGYPAAFVERCDENVVSREDDVRAVLAKIELGEGDAGIVYQTDAATSPKLGRVAIPDEANVSAVYSGIVVRGTAQPAAARAFLAWLAGPSGQTVLRRFGFLGP